MITATVLAFAFAAAPAMPPPMANDPAAPSIAQAKEGKRFEAVDLNADGALDRDEAAAFSERLSERFDRIDLDFDGQIQREEWRLAMREARARMQARRIQADRSALRWAALDADGDGTLSLTEIGDRWPPLSERFAQIDHDGDGLITTDEVQAARQARREARDD